VTNRHLLLGAILLSTEAYAQATTKSRSAGLFAGAGIEQNVVADNPTVPSSATYGLGAGFLAGFGFTPNWSVYAHVGRGSVDAPDGKVGASSVDVGARVHFLAGTSRFVPFLQGGVSHRAMTEDETLGTQRRYRLTSRDLLGAGVGMNVHITPRIAVSTSALWSLGEFKRDRTAPELGITAPLLHLGLLAFR
jgi:hypothetical protein